MFYSRLQHNTLLHVLHNSDQARKYLTWAVLPAASLVQHILHSGYLSTSTLEDILKKTLAETMGVYQGEVYGDLNEFYMNNMVFGGTLPAWWGLDVPRSPSSHCEDCIKMSWARLGWHQSMKLVTDMGRAEVLSVLPGGPSGNMLSNTYHAHHEVEEYLKGEYKTSKLHPDT